MVKALSALSARAGIAEERQHKIALNWAMIKIVPEQGRAVMVKPVTANINPAPAIRAINTLAPAPVTPAAPALPVAENIPLALAPQVMNGKMEVVLLPDQYAKLGLSIIVTTPAPIIWKVARLCSVW